MKKLITALVGLFLMFGLSVHAQQYTTLLNPNSAANLSPFSSTATLRLTTLYRPGDFLTAVPSGAITRIYFASASGSGSGTYSNFTVRMGQTNDTAFTSTTFPTLTLCRQNTLVVPSVTANGYIPIDLTTAFPYDSTKSLIVEISYDARTAGNGFSIRSNVRTGTNIALTAATPSSATGSFSTGQRTLGLDLTSLAQRNGGLTDFVSPTFPFTSGAIVPVTVNLTNLGSNPIAQIQLNYRLGNRPVVTESFVTNLNTFASTSLSFTSQLSLPAANDSVLEVWISQVNGSADQVNTNDTIRRTICVPLAAGFYTVGSSTADFVTLQAAIDRINCSGVAGNVTFSLLPGVYRSNFVLNNIPGSGSRITFQSAGGVSSVLLYPSATGIQAPTITIANENQISLSQLTFVRSVAPTSATPLVLMSNGADLQLNACVFIDSSLSTSINNRAVLLENCIRAEITGNRFVGFARAFALTDQDTVFSENNAILQNTFEGALGTAVQLTGQSLLSFTGNTFREFLGTFNSDAALVVNGVSNSSFSSNRWLGTLSRISASFTNLNGAPGVPNAIFNNEITGQTSNNGGTTAITAGFQIVGATAGGPDYVQIAHNSMYFQARSTATSTSQACILIEGGTAATSNFAQLELLNNVITTYPESASSPTNFALVTVSGTSTRDTLVADRNVYFRPGAVTQQALFRVLTPAASYLSLQQWQQATGVDSNSVFSNPVFQSDSLLVPNSLQADNLGRPVGQIATDITGALRSATTPDPGAYEFTGSSQSQFTVVPLTDTTSLNNRTISITIVDSLGLVGGTNGPRMYFRKRGQANFAVDQIPQQSGINYTFLFNYLLLGGIQPGDTIEYYFATLNNSGTVSTFPPSGGGTSPIGSIPPPNLLRYRIVPSALSNYTIGVNGNFASITAAASFINTSNFSSNTTFTLIDSIYGQNETFPIVFTANPTLGPNRRVTILPAVGVNVRIPITLSATVPAMFRFDDAAYITLDGSPVNDTSSRIRLEANNALTGTAIIWLRGSNNLGNNNLIFRNLSFFGNGEAVTGHYAIYGGANTISTAGFGSNYQIWIQQNRFRRIAQGIYFRGLTTDPVDSIYILGNRFGDELATDTMRLRAIEMNTSTHAKIEGNKISTIICPLNTVSPAAIEAITGNVNLVIRNNEIRGIRNTSTTGITQGAYGINIGGTGVLIVNNVIFDLTTRNAGSTSTNQPAGIRLTGSGHKLYYNTVHLNGVHPDTSGEGASAALLLTGTNITGLDVRNNVFANTMSTASNANAYFAAIWISSTFSYAGSTFDHNGYYVANHPNNLVGRFGTLINQTLCPTLDDLAAVARQTNPSSDLQSVPYGPKTPPSFVGFNNLRPSPTIPTLLESGGEFITGIDTPNVDIVGNIRPGLGGSDPDIGAYEFTGIRATDALPPAIDSVLVNPFLAQCVPTTRVIQLWLRDESKIDSVWLFRAVNNGPRVRQLMTFVSGRADSGLWQTNVLPALPGDKVHVYVQAKDSLGNLTPLKRIYTIRDAGLRLLSNQPDTLFNTTNGNLRLRGRSNIGGLVISEMTYTRGGVGGQTNYPAGFPTESSVTAIEISNTSAEPRSLAGIQLRIEGIKSYEMTLPNIVLDSQKVITIVGGIGVDNPQSGVYFFGAPSNARAWYLSSDRVGVYLIDTSTLEVVDAVACRQYRWAPYSPVLPQEAFNLLVTSASGQQLQGGDILPTTWDLNSQAIVSTLGTYNAQLNYNRGGYLWLNQASGQLVYNGSNADFMPAVSGNYILNFSANGCTLRDTFLITLNQPDLRITRILNPVAGSNVNGTANTVRVRIKNEGTVAVTTPFTVNYRATGGSIFPTSSTVGLGAGDSTELTLAPSWTPTVGGPLQFCTFLNAIAADPNRTNDTLCITLNSTVSVDENSLANVRIYPNPTTDQVFVCLGDSKSDVKLEIVDLFGRMVKTEQLSNQFNTISLVDLANGQYLLRLSSPHELRSVRLLVAR